MAAIAKSAKLPVAENRHSACEKQSLVCRPGAVLQEQSFDICDRYVIYLIVAPLREGAKTFDQKLFSRLGVQKAEKDWL